MGSVVLELTEGISGPRLARMLGVSEQTLCRWALLLGYPPVGTGARRFFTPTDALICRAWQVIHGQSGGTRRHHPALCTQAAAAIRRRPARWLAVTPTQGFTCDQAEIAAVLAVDLGMARWPTAAWLIDLGSRRG